MSYLYIYGGLSTGLNVRCTSHIHTSIAARENHLLDVRLKLQLQVPEFHQASKFPGFTPHPGGVFQGFPTT